MSRVKQVRLGFHKGWSTLCLAVKIFSRIHGSQWAAAFAYYALFSMFPLIILFVTVASVFVDRARAGQDVIGYVQSYVPIEGEIRSHIVETIAGVVQARAPAGAVALFVLVWVSLQGFTTLISATNRAWGTWDPKWWRLPLKSLAFLAVMMGTLLLGVAMPVLVTMAKDSLFPVHDFSSRVYVVGSWFVPWLVVFVSLSLFYMLAPFRPTRFAQVWGASLSGTVFLYGSESLFVIYLKNFATLNVLYGAFGGIVALLMWIYLSGFIFIFGACLCAAQCNKS